MVSKNQIKLITSLSQKKFRHANGLFLAEGSKVIGELLQSHFELEHLYQTEDVFQGIRESKLTEVSQTELEKLSSLTNANNCLALFKIPAPKPILTGALVTVLDDIRDPGNLGTIIRLCDWFGIKQVVCSLETADLYNPKTVQATMGSMARVNVNYIDLTSYLQKNPMPIFGTFMDGENIYSSDLPEAGIIVLGNEANGISTHVEAFIQQRVSIPRFGDLQKTESLNVASAAAIVFSEFRRRSISGK